MGITDGEKIQKQVAHFRTQEVGRGKQTGGQFSAHHCGDTGYQMTP